MQYHSTMTRVYRRKLVVVGDAAVGKSALTQMFHSGGKLFPKQYNMTTSVEYHTKTVGVPDSTDQVELHIYDSAGQDMFAELVPSFWRGTHAVLLVYDVTRRHTFESAAERYHRVVEAAGGRFKGGLLPGALVANKMDQEERISVHRPAGLELASSTGLTFFEVSAAEGDKEGIGAPFEHVAALLHKAAVEEGAVE